MGCFKRICKNKKSVYTHKKILFTTAPRVEFYSKQRRTHGGRDVKNMNFVTAVISVNSV